MDISASDGAQQPGTADTADALFDLDRIAREGAPYERLAELRQHDPVHKVEDVAGDPGFWLITKRDDCATVSRDWETFSSDKQNTSILGLTKAERDHVRAMTVGNSIPMMDPPQHGKYRKVVVSAMGPGMVAGLEPRIREISVRLINEALEKRQVDFVEDVAAWLPLEVLAELGDIPDVDRKRIFRLVNTSLGEQDPEYAPSPEEFVAAYTELIEYCMELCRMRAQTPGNDVISLMIHGSVDAEPITAENATAFLQLLLAAGSETTRTTLTHSVLALSRQPEQWELLRSDPAATMQQGVDEMLRWATPIMYFGRACMKDVQLRGKDIKRGDQVIMSYTSANRDEDAFADPLRFDLQRKLNRHVSFGGVGPHMCLGANLARLQLRCFFEELAARVKDIRVTGEPDRLRSTLINGIKHLPLELVSA